MGRVRLGIVAPLVACVYLAAPPRSLGAQQAPAAPAAPVAPIAPVAQDPLERAAWLAGCWEARLGERLVHENWMAPAGGVMLGAGRTVVRGIAVEFEHLRISVRGDRLVYTALPSGQKQTEFVEPAAAGVPLTFENLAHDFPQRISYRRVGGDSLVARVEGQGPTGMRGFDLPLHRTPCPPERR